MTRRVLIVDDDEGFQFYMKSLFGKHDGVEVLQALDGQEALNVVKTLPEPPDMIFLDLNMPVMDGHEFLKRWSEELLGRKRALSLYLHLILRKIVNKQSNMLSLRIMS